MVLKASTRLLPRIARRRTGVGWAAVGTNWKSVAGHVYSCGDIRTRYQFCRSLSFLPIAKHPMSFTAPQPPPLWNHSADDILKLTKDAIEYDRSVQDKVGCLDPKDCTFDSVSCKCSITEEPREAKECFRLGIRKSKSLIITSCGRNMLISILSSVDSCIWG
jgi:hypothetical protein